MPFISTADVIGLLFLLAMQKRRSQVTPQPIRRPATASTAASHTGTLFVPLEVRGSNVVAELWGKAVLSVLGAVVVAEMGKLFTFVKM